MSQYYPVLERIDKTHHVFANPRKIISSVEDVQAFFSTKAYRDIMLFLLQLNRAMFPRKINDQIQTWPLKSPDIEFSEPVRRIQLLLSKLESIIEEAPPDPGPRRFGNISFRKWYRLVEERTPQLLNDLLGSEFVESFEISLQSDSQSCSVKKEVETYLLGSFGSAQRLDYGTGHELSFLAFLACLWKLGVFPDADRGVEERGIVVGVIESYLELVRSLIKSYTLEPAGTHGVWGLDDHFFVPYIFGSAQYSPAITDIDPIPVEGSLPGVPDPSSIVESEIVQKEREINMYFSAIGFINDVKNGPFWEHSPMLFDISGVKDGWGKINKGMIKMYNAEVLSKFPVIQHFPFGSLFSWDRDPSAPQPAPNSYSQQTNTPSVLPSVTGEPASTRAPWSNPGSSLPGTTAVPSSTLGARDSNVSASSNSRLPPQNALSGNSTDTVSHMAPTRAPWAKPS